MAGTASADDGGFSVGQDVVLAGLVGRADLNGLAGILAAWIPESGRWAVLVHKTGESVNVRPVNVNAAPAKPAKATATAARREPARPAKAEAASHELAVGQKVTLVGLVSRPDLNGLVGKLTAYDEVQCRWSLVLIEDRRRLNLRPANLEAVPVRKAAAKSVKGKFMGKNRAKSKQTSEGAEGTEAAGTVKKKTLGASKASKLGAGATRPRGVPKKPKGAPSAYMLFCNATRPEVIAEMRKEWGCVSLPEIARDLAMRWKYLEPKELKKYERMAERRKEAHQAKMQVYKAKLQVIQDKKDPLGALKRKYEHLMPKRPATPYWAFCNDENQKRKASKALQSVEGAEEAGLPSVLTEMWKSLPAEEKAPYELQHKNAKAEFERKNKEWQQTPEYEEIVAMERKIKEKKQAEEQKRQDAEDAEVLSLLKKGTTIGHGLQPQRSAVIVGLTGRPELNHQEVTLDELDEANDRWNVSFEDENGETATLNIRTANLIWSRLLKEMQKVEKQAEENEFQELFKKEGATPGHGLAPGRCAVVTGLPEDDELNGKEVQLSEFEDELDCWLATLVDDKEAAQVSVHPSNLILSNLLKLAKKEEKKQSAWEKKKPQIEAQKAAKQQQKEEEKEAKRAKKEAEEAEIRELIQSNAGAGVGLVVGRVAMITGTSRIELNGQEVQLMEFVEESGRWRVSPKKSDEAIGNLKPENLILVQLQKELEKKTMQAEKDKQKELAKAAKEQQKEAEKKLKAELKEMEKAMKADMKKAAMGFA